MITSRYQDTGYGIGNNWSYEPMIGSKDHLYGPAKVYRAKAKATRIISSVKRIDTSKQYPNMPAWARA